MKKQKRKQLVPVAKVVPELSQPNGRPKTGQKLRRRPAVDLADLPAKDVTEQIDARLDLEQTILQIRLVSESVANALIRRLHGYTNAEISAMEGVSLRWIEQLFQTARTLACPRDVTKGGI